MFRSSAGLLVAFSVSCSYLRPSRSLFLALLGIQPCVVLLHLLRDSVESQFLRDGVLPLGRVFSVGCGYCSFSVCLFSWPSFSVRPWSSSFLASSPLVSGPSGASGDCSSVPFPSEGSTLPTFLPWFPPDPPRAPLCVESVERLPTPLVLRLWLASLSAAVAPPPKGPFQTGSQSLGLGVLAMVSWRLIPLFRGWFLSGCACASLCLSLSLLSCFEPLYAGCRCSLHPPCSLFPLVLRGLLTSLVGAYSSFSSGSLSSGLSLAGPLSALAGGLSLGWGTSGSLVAGVFLGGCPVPLSLPGFRAKPQSSVRPLPRSFLLRSLRDFVGSPPAELLLCPFRALRLCFSRAASFPSCPRSLFVSPHSPSRSLSPHAFSFFFRDVLAGAFSSASRSLPSAPCSSYSFVSSFSSSRPSSGGRGLAPFSPSRL